MESILQFMYLGEGRFYLERMEEFIKVAKDLAVKEISEGVEMQNFEEQVKQETRLGKKVEDSDGQNQTLEPENKIGQTHQVTSDVKSQVCPECGKAFTQKRNMLIHYRSVHEGIKYSCNQMSL